MTDQGEAIGKSPAAAARARDERSSQRSKSILIVVIANFAALRREIGVARADLIAGNAAHRVTRLTPGLRTDVVARDRIEISGLVENRGAVAAIAGQIDSAFSEPLLVDDQRCAIDLHIGGAVAGPESADDVSLIDAAERSVEFARDTGERVIHDLASTSGVKGPADLAGDLQGAIQKGELVLQYQPKVHIRRQEVASLEALVRWRHSVHGLIMPGEFIPLAERSGDIVDLTLWTLRQVINDQRVLARRGHDLPIFVNVSAVLLSNAQFVRSACEIVQRSGAKIGFEITETAVIRDPESAIAHLRAFADIGITLSIDDYGAGLSSLAYLKRMPASELKIDKLFVTQLTTSHRDPLIVRSTIDLAHAMEMEVVAEGVETPGALALLSVMGCDMAQGFLISRPIDMSALLVFLSSDKLPGLEPPKPIFAAYTSARRA